MSWPLLRAAVDLLLEAEQSEVELTFYGGEPLLEMASIERAIGYAQERRRPDQTVRYEVSTNGTRMGSAEAAFLAAHRVRVQLSFDGVAAAQALRGERTHAVLDRLLDDLRRSHEAWFRDRLGVAMTVLPETVPHLAAGVRYLLAKGVAEVGLSPVFTDSSSWRPEQIGELDEQMQRIFAIGVDHYRRTGRVALEIFRRRRRRRPDAGGGWPMCRVGRGESLVVDVDGQLYGCPPLSPSARSLASDLLRRRLSGLRLGDVRSRRWRRRLADYRRALRRAEIFDRHERKHSSYGRCRDCEYLDRCAVCPVAIGHIPGNRDPHRVPDFLCAFNLVVNRHAERFPRRPDPIELIEGRIEPVEFLRRLVVRRQAERAATP